MAPPIRERLQRLENGTSKKLQ